MKIRPAEIKKMFETFLEANTPNCGTYLTNIKKVNSWAKEHNLVKETIYEKYLPKDVEKLIDDLSSKVYLKRNDNAYYSPLNKWYRKFCTELYENDNLSKSNYKNLREQSKIKNKNIEEQEELEQFYKKKSKEEIRNELKNLKESAAIEIIVNNKRYKRDNKTVAQIKILRDFKCQICETFILKKDGSRYVEGAHIIEKHKKGSEIPSNIILLCPNHHKEFDLGNKLIKEHSESKLIFILNNIKYSINLNL